MENDGRLPNREPANIARRRGLQWRSGLADLSCLNGHDEAVTGPTSKTRTAGDSAIPYESLSNESPSRVSLGATSSVPTPTMRNSAA